MLLKASNIENLHREETIAHQEKILVQNFFHGGEKSDKYNKCSQSLRLVIKL